MIFFGVPILLGFTSFYFFSARKQRSFFKVFDLVYISKIFRRIHSIRSLQINLIFCSLFLSRLFLDQALNIAFQKYYKELGNEDIFNVWWLSFYLENIFWTRQSTYRLQLYDSDFYVLNMLNALWIFSDCSLSALWLRKMKIDCSKQVSTEQTKRTNGQRFAFLKLL